MASQSEAGAGQTAPDARERFNGWKQIAAYLEVSERTVRRWQQTENLPVHRHLHQQRGSVWAYRQELDDWRKGRLAAPASVETSEKPSHRGLLWVGLAITAAAAVLIVTLSPGRPQPAGMLPDGVPLTAYPGPEYGESFSPDGRQIAFYHFDGVRSGVYIKSLEAADATLLASGDDFTYSPAWSPDGKTIAFLRRTAADATAVYLIAPTGGPERRLATLSTAAVFTANFSQLCWTPDSQWLFAPASVDGRRPGIHLISVKTGAMRRITEPTDPQTSHYGPALSPDARSLAYFQQDNTYINETVMEVFRLNMGPEWLPTGPAERLYKGRSQSSGMAWAPSGKELILCNADSFFLIPFNSRLFRLPARAGGLPVPFGGQDCMTPAISRPDSAGRSMLAYGVRTEHSNLWLAALPAGTSPVAAAAPFVHSSRFDVLPDFSPDGRYIAFLSNRTGAADVWVCRADGSEMRRLTTNFNLTSGPRWSGDGASLVLSVTGENSAGSIYVFPVSGGAPVKITTSAKPVSSPFWSRDGRWIYYLTEGELQRVSAGGGKPATVIRSIGVRSRAPLVWTNGTFYASPDGRSVLYTTFASPYALCRVSLDSGAEEVIQDGVRSRFFTVSQRNIYFLMDNDFALYRRPVTGGPAQRLGTLSPSLVNVSGRLTNYSMAVAPDDSRLLYSRVERQEIDLQLIRDFR